MLRSLTFFNVLLVTFAFGCQKDSDDKEDPVVVATPPNTCVTMSILGEFPDPSTNKQTWFYGCQEGFEMWEGRKLFLADSACKNGQTLSNNPEFPFVKIESQSCPQTDVAFSCVGESWKIYGYRQPQELFSKDTFQASCSAKGGVFQEK